MNILKSVKNFFLFDAIIFFDLEFTCWENSLVTNWSDTEKPPEVLQIGCVFFDLKRNEFTSEFSSYVYPIINPKLSKYCRNLLKIDQTTIDNADNLVPTLAEFSNWLSGFSKPYCISSWGYEDLVFLYDDCTRNSCKKVFVNKPYFDLMRISNAFFDNYGPDYYEREQIQKLLKINNLQHSHDSLQDALELKEIFMKLKNKI